MLKPLGFDMSQSETLTLRIPFDGRAIVQTDIARPHRLRARKRATLHGDMGNLKEVPHVPTTGPEKEKSESVDPC